MQELHDAIERIYTESNGPISNQLLYKKIKEHGFVDLYGCIGDKKYNLLARKVRWHQQTLKSKNILVKAGRGCWELRGTKAEPLHELMADKVMLAFSTDLGVAIWGRAEVVGKEVIDEDVHLILTSMFYPLSTPRAYGNPVIEDYLDLVAEIISPWVGRLSKGGSIVINLSNDIFMHKSPARSTYWMKFALMMEERFGLFYMDLMPWVSNKLAGPTLYTCINTQRIEGQTNTRMHLCHGYEPILWFTNDPWAVHSKNNRVLKPHTSVHQSYIENGGAKKRRVVNHGNNVIRKGSFSNQTEGTIPRNVLNFSNHCVSGRLTIDFSKSVGLTTHTAKWPESLTRFLVEFLTEPNQLVADICAGTLTVGETCEILGRRWICVEKMYEYILQSFTRFSKPGSSVRWNPYFTQLFEKF